MFFLSHSLKAAALGPMPPVEGKITGTLRVSNSGKASA